ncbi:MAG: hypothetical protein PVH41_14780 [Anaerolineae bacterium]|jgi:hypothetical protein
MNRTRRVLIGVAILIVVGGALLGLEAARRQRLTEADLEPGSIPIYVEGDLAAAFVADDRERLEQVAFQDEEEGKTQEGWMLRDVLLLHIPRESLTPRTLITVSSSSRGRSAQLTWAEVDSEENRVMFDLSGRGTLKLVSKLPRLDVRDEWVQDTDRIEVNQP